ncbi:MAG: putative 2-aminoethylphosphonate transport system permease protein PhnV [Paracidovorax wautersii]|uniref:Putative 2-aminoethylphosphonate transport system permease protein PhnV n=1 Tax=Paracidovorax wautersii TaxID=1177982 RepID=A0A7V8FQ79_9BURK|nr:MAG: putative 2-aminoethylphosphonate transport system permease protein PhnV [Paracidovorax wautersii]
MKPSTWSPDLAWRVAAALLAAGVLVPIGSLAWLAAGADWAHWRHLAAHVLPAAAANTAWLLAGVGVIVLVVGTGCAWLVTAYDFPGRRVFNWALLLPLAMPTYIVAFAYLDLLHPIGPVQEAIRWVLGYDSPRQFRLPDLRSTTGAVFVLGFVLYPYVYLTARALFMTQPAHLLEAARTLGAGPLGVFFRVALLETLNDIGASEFLGVQTLTVTVYTTWITRSDLAAAAQIACAMLAMVTALVLLEQRGRQRQRFGVAQRMRGIVPARLAGWRAGAASAVVALPIVLGFVAPALYLVWETAKRLSLGYGISSHLMGALGNTLTLAAGVTAAAMGAALVIAWGARLGATRVRAPWLLRWPVRVAALGYAVPGTVLAIGLLSPALAFDAWLADGLGLPGLPLMSLGIILVVCCAQRFLAIAVGGIEAGLARIPPVLEQAARLLGERPGGVLLNVHLPLLRPALGAAALLVFVDAMKELPATLLLRPANFETLATSLYAEAARGTYEEGAVAALAIVLAGLLPVVLLARTQLKATQARMAPDVAADARVGARMKNA